VSKTINVSVMTCHFSGTTRERWSHGEERLKSESWRDCKRWPVTVLTWRAAKDCSRYEGRRPEKLGHRRLTAAYGGQSVTMPRQNADDIELRCLLAGRVRRRGTAVLNLADTCTQGEPACNQSAPPPSTNVVDGAVGWCAFSRREKHQKTCTRIAYLNFCSGHMHIRPWPQTYGLSLEGTGLGIGLEG